MTSTGSLHYHLGVPSVACDVANELPAAAKITMLNQVENQYTINDDKRPTEDSSYARG